MKFYIALLCILISLKQSIQQYKLLNETTSFVLDSNWNFYDKNDVTINDYSPKSTICNNGTDSFLLFGGMNAFGRDKISKISYSFSNLAPYYTIKVQMKFYKIHIWAVSKLTMLFDSISGCSYQFLERVYPNGATQSSICSPLLDDLQDNVDETITNCASTPDIRLVIYLSLYSNKITADCFFGFRDLNIEFLFCNSTCKNCTGNGDSECTDCYFRYYKTSASVGKCLLCNESCGNCSGPNTNQCIDCIIGYYLINGVCEECDSACLTCSGPGNSSCIKCSSLKIFSGKTCVCYPSWYIYEKGCVSSCPTDTVYYDNECLSSCPTDKMFLNIDTCVSNCSDTTFIYNNSCLHSSCPTNTVMFGRTCVSECPKGMFLDIDTCVYNCPDTTYQYIDTCFHSSCPTNTVICECPTGMFLSIDDCVSNCPITTYLYIDSCLHSCPTNTVIFERTCVNECPSGMFLDIDTCVMNCPITTYLYNYSCLHSSCPTDTVLYDRTCLNECPNSTLLYESSCVLECSGKTILENNLCLDKCPVGTYRNNQTCLEKCPDTLVSYNFSCYAECPFSLINYLQQCVSNCPNYTYIENRTCVYTCPLYANFNNKSCISSCPNNFYELFKICYSTCPSTFVGLNGSCITECPINYTETNKICIVDCEKKAFILNDECCPVCSAGYYADSKTLLCIECNHNCKTCSGPNENQCSTCNSSAYLIKEIHSCIQNCPNYYYSNAQTKECIKCSDNCLQCQNSKNCIICDSKTKILNTICKMIKEIKTELVELNNPFSFKIYVKEEWGYFSQNFKSFLKIISIGKLKNEKDYTVIANYNSSDVQNIHIIFIYNTIYKTSENMLNLWLYGVDDYSDNFTSYSIDQNISIALKPLSALCKENEYHSESIFFFLSIMIFKFLNLNIR